MTFSNSDLDVVEDCVFILHVCLSVCVSVCRVTLKFQLIENFAPCGMQKLISCIKVSYNSIETFEVF